jgi:hypothetical protein
MTLEIVKAVPSYENSYQKTKIGGLLRSTLDLFVTKLLPKTAGFWLKILWTHSTINSSENTTENSIKTVHKLSVNYKLQLRLDQFISSVRFDSFVVIVYIKKPLTSIRIERGALQYVIKPFLYCDLFKASARAEKEKRKTFVFKEKLRTRIVQLISINVYFNFNLQLHRKIGFSNSGLFVN